MADKKYPKHFPAYLVTQSLGAFNDNLFKMLIQLYVLQIAAKKLILEEKLIAKEEFIFLAALIFAIPFVLFGPWSGYLSDKFSKVKIMRVVKFFEIIVMGLGIFAFWKDDTYLMFVILFLMTTQSSFFGPAKYGYIPEACKPQWVSAANGWLEMTTFVSIIFGTAVTGFILSYHNENALIASSYCAGIALIGFICSLGISDITNEESASEKSVLKISKKFPWNPFSHIITELKFLKKQKTLFLAALANSYFWLMGSIFQTNILIYGQKILQGNPNSTILLAFLPAFIGFGIAAGSLLASRWSGKKVEIGLVPFGGAGIGMGAMALFFTTDSYWATTMILLLAGIFGGLYIVPLYAYLQFYAKKHEKGRVMAAHGIVSGFFLVLGALIYGFFSVTLEIPANKIYLILGIVTILVVVYICTVIPEYFIRFSAWLLTHSIYRIKIIGEENIPFYGPALLTANHVTYVDSLLINSTMQRLIRFVMLESYYRVPILINLFKLMNVIPINPSAGKESILKSLNAGKKQLQNNHVVCIFPEGQLTKDGSLNPFKPGFETIMKTQNSPIIPVYLHNVWGSIFSLEGGKKIFKWPKTLLRSVTIIFGKPMPSHSTAEEVEAAVRGLSKELEEGKI